MKGGAALWTVMCEFWKRMPSNLMYMSLGCYVRVTRDTAFHCPHTHLNQCSLSIRAQQTLPEAGGERWVAWVKGVKRY